MRTTEKNLPPLRRPISSVELILCVRAALVGMELGIVGSRGLKLPQIALMMMKEGTFSLDAFRPR